jgi:hypothetical protein
MIVPGSNILSAALAVISSNCFQYYSFSSRAYQPNGQYLSNYDPPCTLRGSVQAVPRNLYQVYGLDFDKYYLKFYVSKDVIDVSRNSSGDLFVFQCNTYQCLSVTPWFGIDGWNEVLAVQVQNTPLVITITAPTTGNYNTGAQLLFTVNFNSNVTVTGTPYIALSALSGIIGGNALYTAGSGSSTLTFAYTVVSGDTANGIAAASPLVGTITNVVTNSADAIPANGSFAVPNLSGITLNA